MGGDEIDAASLAVAVMGEEIGGAGKRRCKIACRPGVATPVAAEGVAGAVVPFEKGGREAAELVSTGPMSQGSAIRMRSSSTSSSRMAASVGAS